MDLVLYWTLSLAYLFVPCSLVTGAPANTCTDKDLAIHGGTYTLSDGFNYGSEVFYECPHGFFAYPAPKRKCEKGSWSHRYRKGYECRVVECPNPQVMENGNVFPYQPKYYLGNRTTFSCHSGYSLRGSSSRVCRPNGKWSGSTSICSRDSDHCLDPGIPPGASRTGHIFNIDDKVTYRCENRLILIGSKERVCKQGGQWSGTEPQCYYYYTYDTPEDVATAFGSSLSNSLTISEYAGINETDQTGRRVKMTQGGNLNIYIALDASDSISEEQFQQSKTVIRKLIDKISYYEVNPKYEIMVFASEVHEIVNIVDFYTNRTQGLGKSLKDLDEYSYDAKGDKSGTNIVKAFSLILDKIVYVEARDVVGFKDIYHVIIMFTDGMANMGGKPKPKVDEIRNFVLQGDPQREEFLDLYVFGLGQEIQKEDVNDYVTQRDDEQFFFILPELKDLEKTMDLLIDEDNSRDLCGLTWDYGSDSLDSENKRDRHPWLAEISVTRNRPEKSSNCLGVMVSPQFILTAAHCFKFNDKPDMILVEIADTPQNRIKKVSGYVPHPMYNTSAKKDEGISEFYDYDVALIQLAKNVKLSRTARPICIPCTKGTSGALRLSGHVTCNQHKEMLLHNTEEKASFMSVDRRKIIKKSAVIKLGDARSDCIEDAKLAEGMSKVQKAEDIVTKNFLCTGGIEPTRDDIACKGDSGGALFVERGQRLVQVGVVSWGVKDLCTIQGKQKPDSESTTRDFHINLFSVLPFLKKHLQDTSYDPITFLDDAV